MQKLGSAGVKIFKATTAAVATGVTALGTAALTSYADYEQLVGGSKLLFGDAYDFITEKASEAYKTVQMSQSAYLEQVNGFSTGLKTALKGDERAAAELADRIITAEADVVAATGNSQEAVQNAFNGIMKSNFTMLDNLQLGITPTKKGFQEVIDKVNEWNKTNGEATSYQIDNLADCQSALIDYIEMQGLAGYAGKEALTTISGSLSSVKASWENLTVAIATGEDIDVKLEEFIDSVITAGENLVPRVVEIGKSIVGVVKDEIIPGIAERAPEVIQSGYELLSKLVDGFTASIPEKLPLLLDLIQKFADGVSEKVPIIIQKGFELLGKFVDGIVSGLPTLIEKVPTIITTFANVINDNFPTILLKGAEIIWKLITGIISAIPTLIQNIPKIITAIVSVIQAFQWTNLGKNIITWFKNGITNMVGAVKNAGTSIGNAIKNALNDLPSALSNLGKNAINNLGSAISGLQSWIKTQALKIASGIESAINTLPEKMVSIGKDIISGIWSGISSSWGWLTDKVGEVADSLFKKAKKVLGIESPSKKFKYLAEMCTAGWDEGSEGLMDTEPFVKDINANFATLRMNTSGAKATGGFAGSRGVQQIININQPISTPDEMARAIRLESRYGLMRGIAYG